jgi:hypothetical protein
MEDCDFILTEITPYQLILEDLQREGLNDNMTYSPPYTNGMTLDEKFSIITRMMFRAKRVNNRILFLVNAFYLGEFLETLDNLTTRAIYVRKLTQHYYRASVRLYYLYEILGTSQLAKSRNVTFNLLLRITKSQLNQLINEATNIFARTQNVGGE